MYLKERFLKLPLQFDAQALAREVDALPADAWVPHPNNHPGNTAVRLATSNGEMTDSAEGQMAPTRWLRACPYIMEVMAAIGGTWGRCRLMGLAPGAAVPPHIDTNYYWRKHVRMHVPIITQPEVSFTAGDETVHMAAGQCWIFDTYAVHHVKNGGRAKRVHLVMDTVGGEDLWALTEKARAGRTSDAASEPVHIGPGMGDANALRFEQTQAAAIMSPWELQCHVQFIAENLLSPHQQTNEKLAPILERVERFVASWHGLWAQYGPAREAVQAYRAAITRLEGDLLALGGEALLMRNHLTLYRQLAELLFTVSATLDAAPSTTPTQSPAQELAR